MTGLTSEEAGSLAGEVRALLVEEVDGRRTCRATQAAVIRHALL